MEFGQDGCDRSGWLTEVEKPLKQIHVVDTMPDFHYDTSLKSMYMDVVKPNEDQRCVTSSSNPKLLTVAMSTSVHISSRVSPILVPWDRIPFNVAKRVHTQLNLKPEPEILHGTSFCPVANTSLYKSVYSA